MERPACCCVWVIVTDDRSEFGDVFVLLCVDVDIGEYRFEAATALEMGEPFNDAYGWDNPLLLLLGEAAARYR